MRTALALALLCALLAGRTLLEPGFFSAHDNPLNVHRLYELDKCVEEGALRCRWMPDMGQGRGVPLFVYYPPLGTWVGEGFRLLGFPLLVSVKLSFLLALLVAAGGMFGLALPFFGPAGALVSSVFYTWSPYFATDVFVRGALAELWGLALLPYAFLAAHGVLAGRARRVAWTSGLALAWGALLATHPLVALMSAVPYAIFCCTSAWRRSDLLRASVPAFLLAHLLGLALAATAIVPALVERDAAHTGTLVDLYAWTRYENNFLGLGELLHPRPEWGYGPFRAPGGMALLAGGVQWSVASALALALALRAAARRSTIGAPEVSALVFTALGWLAILMATPASRAVWELLPPLAWLQFPWRHLGIAAFAFAFAGGAAPWLLRRDPIWRRVLAATLVTGVVASGWTFFRPSSMVAVRDDELANDLQVARLRHGLFDFLPRSVALDHVPVVPPARLPTPAELVEGSGELEEMTRGTQHSELVAVIGSPTAVLRINTHSFPGWVVRVDGQAVERAEAHDPLGRIHVSLGRGRHRVRADFEDTPIRRWSDRVSAVAALAVAGGFVAAARRKPRRAPGEGPRA